jgi:hypothetical protein
MGTGATLAPAARGFGGASSPEPGNLNQWANHDSCSGVNGRFDAIRHQIQAKRNKRVMYSLAVEILYQDVYIF